MADETDPEIERHAQREREYEKRQRQQPLMFMAAVIASGMSSKTDQSPGAIADRSLTIAQAIFTKVAALP